MLGNLIRETSNAPGSAADVLLAGPSAGYLPFGFWFASGALCFYAMRDASQAEWGIGTYTSGSPNKITRTTVLRNSAGSTARLNFLGTTAVYNDVPSERSLWIDNNQTVKVPGWVQAENLLIDSTAARIVHMDPTAPVNARVWDWQVTTEGGGAKLLGRALNDAISDGRNWLQVTRSGFTITSITLAGTAIALTGTLTVTGAMTVSAGLHVSLGATNLDADVNVGQYLAVSTANVAQAYRLWALDHYRVIEWTGVGGWNFEFDSNTNDFYYFNDNATALLWSQGATGNFFVVGSITAANVSDERVKRDAVPFTRGLREVIELFPISYEYNGLGGTIDTGERRIGLIAQDVLPHMPEMVFETPLAPTDQKNTRKDIVRDPRLPGQLSLDDKPLVYALLNAVRELAQRVAVLEDRAAALEAHP